MAAKEYFKLFSDQAGNYAAFRPTYPAHVFQKIYDFATPGNRALALDCGTGQGQAAKELAKTYRKVIGMDANVSQLQQATPIDNVEFREGDVHATGLPASMVNLVTAAQAFHWFLYYQRAHTATKASFAKLGVAYRAADEFHAGCIVFLAYAWTDVLLLAFASLWWYRIHSTVDTHGAEPKVYTRFRSFSFCLLMLHSVAILGLLIVLLILAAAMAVLYTEHNAVMSIRDSEYSLLRTGAMSGCPASCFSPTQLAVVFPYLQINGKCVCNLEDLNAGSYQLYKAVLSAGISLLFGIVVTVMKIHMLAMLVSQVTAAWYDHMLVAKREAEKHDADASQFVTNLYIAGC